MFGRESCWKSDVHRGVTSLTSSRSSAAVGPLKLGLAGFDASGRCIEVSPHRLKARFGPVNSAVSLGCPGEKW